MSRTCRRTDLFRSRTAPRSGKRDQFIVDLESVGPVTEVLIGHDGTGAQPAWHLDHVVVADKKQASSAGG